jgi:hypothetical protein
MRMAKVQQMTIANLGKPDTTYDLRYISLILALRESEIQISQAALKQAQHQQAEYLRRNM